MLQLRSTTDWHSENTPDSNTLQRRRGRTRLLTKTLHSATLRLQRLHQQRRSLTQHLTHVSPFFLSLQSKYVYNAAIVSGIACHFVLQKLQQQHQRDYSQESKGETTLQWREEKRRLQKERRWDYRKRRRLRQRRKVSNRRPEDSPEISDNFPTD